MLLVIKKGSLRQFFWEPQTHVKTDSIHIFVRLSVTINRASIHLDKQKFPTSQLKETKSVTMNIFRKNFFSFSYPL